MHTQSQDYLSILFYGTALVVFILGSLFFFIVSHRNRVLKLHIEMKEKEAMAEKEVNQSLLLGEEKERIRISEELHDGLGAKLSGIKMQLEKQLEGLDSQHTLAHIHQQLNESINELRHISHHLQPEFIHRLGLMNAISQLIHQLNHVGQTQFNLFSNLGESSNLDRELSLHIYRIISELLNNIVKHTHATEAYCQVLVSEGNVVLTIEDNGKGFIQQTDPSSHGIGLQNIQHRIRLLKGTFQIETLKGTSIIIEIPITTPHGKD